MSGGVLVSWQWEKHPDRRKPVTATLMVQGRDTGRHVVVHMDEHQVAHLLSGSVIEAVAE